jgi:hypothetical protein
MTGKQSHCGIFCLHKEANAMSRIGQKNARGARPNTNEKDARILQQSQKGDSETAQLGDVLLIGW